MKFIFWGTFHCETPRENLVEWMWNLDTNHALPFPSQALSKASNGDIDGYD